MHLSQDLLLKKKKEKKMFYSLARRKQNRTWLLNPTEFSFFLVYTCMMVW